MLQPIRDRDGKVRAVVTGNPTDGEGEAPEKRATWGDRLLRRRHQRVRCEAMLQTRHLAVMAGAIDGELYTGRCTRGNIRTRVVRGGTPRHPRGSRYLLHPFAKRGVADQLPVRVHDPRRWPKGNAEPAATLATDRPPEVAAA